MTRTGAAKTGFYWAVAVWVYGPHSDEKEPLAVRPWVHNHPKADRNADVSGIYLLDESTAGHKKGTTADVRQHQHQHQHQPDQ